MGAVVPLRTGVEAIRAELRLGERDGRAAFYNGRLLEECPHLMGTNAYKGWRHGWRVAMADRINATRSA